MLNLIDDDLNKVSANHMMDLWYIHTDGIGHSILYKNNKKIYFNQIIQLFKDQNCEHLINKPKFICFDCCRNS